MTWSPPLSLNPKPIGLLRLALLLAVVPIGCDDPVELEREATIPSPEATGSFFGVTIDTDGARLAVGASGYEENFKGRGRGHLFTRDGSNWSRRARLTGDAPTEPFPEFGSSIALSGDTIFVGAPGRSSGPAEGSDGRRVPLSAGAVWVFDRSSSGWARADFLTAPKPRKRGGFGEHVEVQGDTVVVGENGINADYAHVFRRDGGDWSHRATLTPPDSLRHAAFGSNFEFDGDQVIFGGSFASQLLVYGRAEGDWKKLDVVDPPAADDPDSFGGDLALDGELLVVGAMLSWKGSPEIDGTGAAYAYRRTEDGWRLDGRLEYPGKDVPVFYGDTVAIADKVAAVAAGHYDPVEIFERDGGEWNHVETLEPPPGKGSLFGDALEATPNRLFASNPSNDSRSYVHVYSLE